MDAYKKSTDQNHLCIFHMVFYLIFQSKYIYKILIDNYLNIIEKFLKIKSQDGFQRIVLIFIDLLRLKKNRSNLDIQLEK